MRKRKLLLFVALNGQSRGSITCYRIKTSITNSIKRFMGISAELLVRDKTIVFDEFKAIGTISHVDDVFVSRNSSEYGEPYSLMV